MKGIENIYQGEGSRFFIYLAIAILISIVCALSLSAISDDSHADDETFWADGIEYRIVGDGQVEISSTDKDISEYHGVEKVSHFGTDYRVVAIGENSFKGCCFLTVVEIPNSVYSISNFAFEGCSSLHTLKIPDSVKVLGANAFALLPIKDLTVPVGLRLSDSYRRSPFLRCDVVEKITFTPSDMIVNYVSDFWFYDSSSHGCDLTPMGFSRDTLKTVVFEEGVKVIGSYMFYKCTALTSVTFPETLETINNDAFKHCNGLKSITFPKSLKTIGEEAFENCENLISVYFPDSLETICDQAFCDCRSLENIQIPASVKIGSDAFENCPGYEDQ